MMNEVTCGVCSKCCNHKQHSFPFDSFITSDCMPFGGSYTLFSCAGCGVIQAVNSVEYASDVASIYKNYSMFYQGSGMEQKILSNGKLGRRSNALVEYLSNSGLLFDGAKVLDVGCGNGDFLRNLSGNGNYTLDGYEYDESSFDLLNDVPGFRQLMCGSFDEINESYDLIVLIHSLEHFFQPKEVLQALKRILKINGKVVLQVPNPLENPFDLIIVDHVFHFTPMSLESLAANSGFGIERLSTQVATREITMILSQNSQMEKTNCLSTSDGERIVSYVIKWFEVFIGDVLVALRDKSTEVALFGTSIGGIWLNSMFPNAFSYFVDEDDSRVGRTLFGKKVLSMNDIPSGAVVVIPIAPLVADGIRERLLAMGYCAISPRRYEPMQE